MTQSIIGINKKAELLLESVGTGEYFHAYLFDGPGNTGKTSFALQLAKKALCSNFGVADECQCQDCHAVSSGNHPDLHILDGYASSLDELRELMSKLDKKPYQSHSRVAVISHADQLSTQALNSLLKTLEEPPANTMLIITTENRNSLPATILSRVHCVGFNVVDSKKVFRHLNEEAGVNKVLAERATMISGGRMGLAIDFSNNPEGVDVIIKNAEEIYRLFDTDNLVEQVLLGAVLAAPKSEVDKYIDLYINYFAGRLLSVADGDKGESKLLKLLDSFALAKTYLKQNANTKLVMESLMLGNLI